MAVKGSGRSMESDLAAGGVAVLDRNDRVIMPDSIFAIRDFDGGSTVKYIKILDPEHFAYIPANSKAFKMEFMKLLAVESIGDRITGRLILAGQSFISGREAAIYFRPTDISNWDSPKISRSQIPRAWINLLKIFHELLPKKYFFSLIYFLLKSASCLY